LSASTIHGSAVWQTLQRGVPSAVGRTRLRVPQLVHLMIVDVEPTLGQTPGVAS
jgi:hypothetical protein